MRRMNQTIASLEALGNHLAGIPGRKNMVWISGGIRGADAGRAGSLGQQLCVAGARRWRSVSRRRASPFIRCRRPGCRSAFSERARLRQARARGRTKSVQLRPMTRENDLRIWGTMDMLADVTGGRVVQEHATS